MRCIDLRSDTVTLPTDAMREAMSAAPLGDDGLDGDPTVCRLEALAASLLGKPQALFVTSGIMGNLVASLAHACNGGEAIADEHAHIILSEMGGISRLAGLVCHRIPECGGEMDLNRVREKLRRGHERDGQPTAMVVVESSHNHSGGMVPSIEYMRSLRSLAGEIDAPVHLDGARIFNAAHALGVHAKDIAHHADSVTCCLSKGLSAPMGSVLAGSTEFIQRARTFRRMVGGGLRQAGIVAAAGIVALEKMTARLVDDHRHAQRLWEHLHHAGEGLVSGAPPQTNILMIDVSHLAEIRPAQDWRTVLGQHGVLVRQRDDSTLRAVLHRHISMNEIDEAADILVRVLGSKET